MTKQERRELTNQIRTAIERSGLTRYGIAKASGVAQSALSRFVSGKGSLTLSSLERLAPVLGLRIVTEKKVRK
jgi:transcriptional regulator with XRE-family HTH domain